MKRCNSCQTLSKDTALFCPSCGRSFGVRLCPHLHANPPTTLYCTTCGSGDLSRPHPTKSQSLLSKFGIALLIVGVILLAVFFFLTTFVATFSGHLPPI